MIARLDQQVRNLLSPGFRSHQMLGHRRGGRSPLHENPCQAQVKVPLGEERGQSVNGFAHERQQHRTAGAHQAGVSKIGDRASELRDTQPEERAQELVVQSRAHREAGDDQASGRLELRQLGDHELGPHRGQLAGVPRKGAVRDDSRLGPRPRDAIHVERHPLGTGHQRIDDSGLHRAPQHRRHPGAHLGRRKWAELKEGPALGKDRVEGRQLLSVGGPMRHHQPDASLRRPLGHAHQHAKRLPVDPLSIVHEQKGTIVAQLVQQELPCQALVAGAENLQRIEEVVDTSVGLPLLETVASHTVNGLTRRFARLRKLFQEVALTHPAGPHNCGRSRKTLGWEKDVEHLDPFPLGKRGKHIATQRLSFA